MGYYAVIKITTLNNNEGDSYHVLNAYFVTGTVTAHYANYLILDSQLHETGTITVFILLMKTEAKLHHSPKGIQLIKSRLFDFKAGFLKLGTTNIPGCIILCHGECPEHCWVFNSIPGLYHQL